MIESFGIIVAYVVVAVICYVVVVLGIAGVVGSWKTRNYYDSKAAEAEKARVEMIEERDGLYELCRRMKYPPEHEDYDPSVPMQVMACVEARCGSCGRRYLERLVQKHKEPRDGSGKGGV